LYRYCRWRLRLVGYSAAVESILEFFSQGIEFENGVDSLRDWNQQIWHGSLGVVGNVSEWIRDAVVAMDVSGDTKLSYQHLKATCPADWDLAMNRKSLAEGETDLRGKENPLESFRPKGSIREIELKPKKDRPFQTKPARRKQGGRLNRSESTLRRMLSQIAFPILVNLRNRFRT